MASREFERKITVLFGSETGTAEEIAEQIWRQSKNYDWFGPVLPMDSFDVLQLPNEHIIVFVCSTCGQGEEPANMKSFWKFLLRKSLPCNFLAHTRIAVLGLGDSSYVKFNFVAKRLYKRLLQLGAESLVELGLANDQHDLGVDGVAVPWILSLWEALKEIYPMELPFGCLLFPNPMWNEQSRYQVELLGDIHTSSVRKAEGTATVVQNSRITSKDHFQDVRLLSISAPDLVYNPGDVLQVQPCNLEEDIQWFLRLFGISPFVVVNLKVAKGPYPLPLHPGWDQHFPCTLEHCARELLDLKAPPRKYALEILAKFTASTVEKERLLELCAPEGQEDYIEYCIRPKRSILEMLEEFPVATATLPLQYIFDLFRPLRPRYFSIASAAEAVSGCVELLVAVVEYKTRLQNPRLGLCSNWMARLEPGDVVSCAVQKGSLKFPADHHLPLIMVGPGTGCAPFRSLVQKRHALGSKGRLVLFLGFRNREKDFHCKAEWESYVAEGFLQLTCAFSRDQQQKCYVQHKLLEQGHFLWELLGTEKAHFFVAGNSKDMPTAVRDAVVQLISHHKPCTQDDAENYVKEMEMCGRYQTETWA